MKKLSNGLLYDVVILKNKRREQAKALERSTRYSTNLLHTDNCSSTYKNCAVTIKVQKSFYKFLQRELTQGERDTLLVEIQESVGGLNKFKTEKNKSLNRLDEDELMGELERIFWDIIPRYASDIQISKQKEDTSSIDILQNRGLRETMDFLNSLSSYQ